MKFCERHNISEQDCLKNYEFAPGMINFSSWKRDHTDWPPPEFKVGDKVLFTHELYICRVGQDCDGEPLFAASLEDPASLTEKEKKIDWSVRISCFSAESFKKIGENK